MRAIVLIRSRGFMNAATALRRRCASAACSNKILICGKRNNKWKRIWSVCPQSWWNASALRRRVSFGHSSRHSFGFGKNTFVRTWTWLFRQVCSPGRWETLTGWHLWCCVTCGGPHWQRQSYLSDMIPLSINYFIKTCSPPIQSVSWSFYFSHPGRGSSHFVAKSSCYCSLSALWDACPDPPAMWSYLWSLRGWPLADQALPVFPSLSAHRPFISAAPRARLFILSDSD